MTNKTKNDPVRWGALGGGSRVLQRRMIPTFGAAQNAELVAVASRDLTQARQIANENAVGRAYGSYDELLADTEIEAVYIPLPNDLHAEWTIRALDAGKHVLCDKPGALSTAEADQVAAAARRADRRVLEGFMYRFHPQHQRVRQWLADGKIGPPRTFRGVFTYPASGATATGIRWDKERGGGALLDVGVYPVDAARWLFAAEPEAVFAAGAFDESSGVDRHVSAVLEFPGARTATISGGFDQVFTSRYEIAGERGVITAERAFQVGESGVTLTLRIGDDVQTEQFPHLDQWQREIEHFSDCVRDPNQSLAPGENGQSQARVVEALRRSLTERRRVAVVSLSAETTPGDKSPG